MTEELSEEFILQTAFEKQVERKAEEKLNRECFHDKIELLLIKEGITSEFLDELIPIKKKHFHKQFYEFNEILRKIMSEHKGIYFLDILLMMEERWCDIIQIRNCLDDSNEYELRIELGSKYGKSIRKQLFQRYNNFVY